MKNWFSICLVLILIGGGVLAVAQSEYSEETLTVARSVLEDLEVWEEFDPEAQYITRAEAAAYVCMLLDTCNTAKAMAEDRVPFYDVDVDCWAYDYLTFLIWLGIIQGDEDKNIRPYDNCTYSEFVKVVVASLGWETYVRKMPSGYPEGYFYVAEKLGIYPLNRERKDDFVTKEDAIIIFYNAIKKPIIWQRGFGLHNNEQGSSILENRKGILQTRGCAKRINDNSISIDEKIYQLNEEQTDFTEGLVLCLYKYDEETDISTVLFLYTISDLNFDYEQPVSSDLPKEF